MASFFMHSKPNSHATPRSGTRAQADSVKRSRARRRERSSSAFFILTLMTLAVIVCYGPSQVYYVAALYWNWEIPDMYPIQLVLYQLIAVLDPLLFALAVKDHRQEFREVYCCATK
ncbi:hypothetical protein RvY_11830 [Ramazzottius varieornatus]|uniref:G-protein coupled receptors family 1 profile domain-containing protein n=1 Tax=Ramazzottius varieornatus TaxID=947166 RepID=A0A1D1VHF4_RAMVA|nr:hypothetical protein RvY_11830 [Ramazzottius varieornatus]